MKRSETLSRSAFTLLELVVVLAILAITTGLAVRALDRVEDQRRYEIAQHGLQELSDAILGAPDERNLDGARIISGFVADMGRLPEAIAESNGFSLGELWTPPLDSAFRYNVRPAVQANGVAPAEEDEEVYVPGGWRGPYVHLPIDAETLLDAWGNPMISPSNPVTTEYVRLFQAPDSPVTAAGQEIRIIRHLGANGREDTSAPNEYDKDHGVSFSDEAVQAGLVVQVEVLDGNSAAVAPTADTVTVRVFGPDPTDSRKIRVVSSAAAPFASNPVTVSIGTADGVTIGPRVVRAYFTSTNGVSTTAYTKSAVKQVTLRPGVNFLQLTIDR